MGSNLSGSHHTPKNIQEGSPEIMREDIDVLSHPNIREQWG